MVIGKIYHTDSMTTLRQLRFLVALSDTLNFSRAAELCHVTQPTLSAGIKELEDQLGVPLAERSKRSVMLTPLGVEMVRRARVVLNDVADIEALAHAHAGTLQGDLRLGAIRRAQCCRHLRRHQCCHTRRRNNVLGVPDETPVPKLACDQPKYHRSSAAQAALAALARPSAPCGPSNRTSHRRDC